MIGNNRAMRALMRIARRNYGRGPSIASPLEDIVGANNQDYVFCSSDKKRPANLDKMFIEYLKQSGLLIDPVTGQKRVLYSLRHTYATRALTHDQIPIYTLSQQMGTSVAMIERYYSHLNVFNARHQLTNMESRQALERRTSFYSAEEYKKEQMQKKTI